MRLFVGRLAHAVTVDDVVALFAAERAFVSHVFVKLSYGYVDFTDDAAACAAIARLNGSARCP